MPMSPSAQPLNGTAHRFVRVDDGRALPVTVKILLEGVRRVGGESEQKAAEALVRYPRDNATVPFRPSRIPSFTVNLFELRRQFRGAPVVSRAQHKIQ